MNEFIKPLFTVFVLLSLMCSCAASQEQQIIPAAERSEQYLPLLENKRVALITNHSAMVGEEHLVDFLLENKVNIVKIFGPEHGFRGNQSDGAIVNDEVDSKTGIPLISLYNESKKPTKAMLEGIDVLIFDVQDIGVRFYTFISTLSYAMEACAENNISFMVLDRPNPNSYYIDGPVLDPSYASFIGVHPVPVVYGMTIGEYALMVKGENWINESASLDLKVIPNENYTHDSIYQLRLAPSPNLPNMRSVLLYPSLCYFEGANVSIGRGTDKPFQVMGYPNSPIGSYEFTPVSIPGVSEYPKFQKQLCKGIDLSYLSEEEIIAQESIHWEYLWEMYESLGEDKFFKSLNHFQKLSGSDQLHQALKQGMSIEEYKASYQDELNDFKKIRVKYLLYP